MGEFYLKVHRLDERFCPGINDFATTQCGCGPSLRGEWAPLESVEMRGGPELG